MAESELSVAYSDLLQEVAAFLGYGPDSSAWSAPQLAELDRYVQAGVRRFYYPPAVEGVEAGYQWSFLSPVATLATVADQGSQELPGNLGRVMGNLHFDENQHRAPITQVSEQRYQELTSRGDGTGHPRHVRVRYREQEPPTGQRFEAAWWPVPDAAYTLTYRYEGYSGKLSDDNPYPLGGMRHAELVVQSCLAVAEQRANDERGLHNQEFERVLASAIEQDRRIGAQHFGHMGDFSEHGAPRRRGYTGATYPITYKGSDV